MKESSNTTKLRVVFHASAKSTNQKSINDNLLTGPIIQDDLFSHLIRFSAHKYVIVADIEKMYRQFLVRKEDRKFQKILWLVDRVMKEFILDTVTFFSLINWTKIKVINFRWLPLYYSIISMSITY